MFDEIQIEILDGQSSGLFDKSLQPVPWKMRLGMVIGMQNEILIGIKKLPIYVSFQIFKWKET